MERKPFIDALKESRDKKEKELAVLNQAIEIVEKDNNWNIIMQAHSII